MPDLVTVSADDLATVVQYAKSTAPAVVWNAADRLFDSLRSKETPDA